MNLRMSAGIALMLVAPSSFAIAAGFTLQAVVNYRLDNANTFPTLQMGALMNITVSFDTDNVNPINSSYAFYGVNPAPNYIQATSGSSSWTAASGQNYLYVVQQHPTVDYALYFAPSTTTNAQQRLQVYFQGAKGSLPDVSVPTGLPNFPYSIQDSFFQIDDMQTGSIVRAQVVPEPGTIVAIACGVAGLVVRRRKQAAQVRG